MILLTTGVLDPREPMAEWILDDWEDNITLSSSLGQHIHGWVDDVFWFSRGGMVFQPNLQNPVQAYLLRSEIPAAIRSLYNSGVSCLFPEINALVEEYRKWGVGSGPLYKVSDEARFLHRVCDLLVLEVGTELWLAAGTPRRWLEPGERIELKSAATEFGEVSYVMRHGDKPNTVDARIHLALRHKPTTVRLFVRAPFGMPMRAVKINDRGWDDWDPAGEVVHLPVIDGLTSITVYY
jgi:hypothetical protein